LASTLLAGKPDDFFLEHTSDVRHMFPKERPHNRVIFD